MNEAPVICGDCRYFVRDGHCGFLASEAGKAKDRPFTFAPFWVWSDCYSDKEQVRANVTSRCATFVPKPSLTAEPCHTCDGRGEVGWFDHSELCPGWVTEACPDCNPLSAIHAATGEK